MINSVLAEISFGDEYAGKSLVERVTGRFYTPDVLATDLAARICNALERQPLQDDSPVRLCDPFCGDGRLVIAVLTMAAARPALRGRHWAVTLCDVDGGAVSQGAQAASNAGAALGLSVSIRVVVGDSLLGAPTGPHDIVVTNPPWELLKPDTRELAHFSKNGADAHKARLRTLCDALDARFPDARAERAWGGWGTNLARCGWELALRSCRSGGVLGIVLPSTILADQTSAPFRRSVLQRSRLVDLSAFPPEARLFARVDQPVVSATFIAGPNAGVDATVRLFGPDRRVMREARLQASEDELAALDFALPVGFGAAGGDLLSSLIELPRLGELEGPNPADLWMGRELDETRIVERTAPGTLHPFIKGRMVSRHQVIDRPTLSVLPSLAVNIRSVPFERVVWRDVARASQRRRMIGTIIPPSWIAGNSLHVAHFRNGDAVRLRALHALLSSYVLEFQVRSRLATGHMSLGVVRTARVPVLNASISASLATRVDALLTSAKPAPAQEAALEAAVAQSYHLPRDVMAAILDHFTTEPDERDAILAADLWDGTSSV